MHDHKHSKIMLTIVTLDIIRKLLMAVSQRSLDLVPSPWTLRLHQVKITHNQTSSISFDTAGLHRQGWLPE